MAGLNATEKGKAVMAKRNREGQGCNSRGRATVGGSRCREAWAHATIPGNVGWCHVGVGAHGVRAEGVGGSTPSEARYGVEA